MPEVPSELVEDDAKQGFVEEMDYIAEAAGNAIFNVELPKIIETVRKEIEENGIEAIRKRYPSNM
jgi:hypothetical protein